MKKMQFKYLMPGVLLFFFMFYGCFLKKQNDKLSNTNIVLDGFIQGTTYHIIYESEQEKDYRNEIDSLLEEFNKTASIYDENSIISRINNNESGVVVNEIFKRIFKKSMEISSLTDGMFDITVGQVVRAWGFGPDTAYHAANINIDSLLEFVGYDKVYLIDNKLVKSNPGVMLDFNAIAQGYSVDLVSEFFQSKGIDNYLIEIGGEVYCSGLKNGNTNWRIGVDRPIEGNQVAGEEIQAVVYLSNKGLATSGNYRKFYYDDDSVKYSHTINPKTGRPVRHNLLSATVIANDCMTADAFATSFMVMGLERSIYFLKRHPEIDALLIYSDSSNEYAMFETEGMKKVLEEFGPN